MRTFITLVVMVVCSTATAQDVLTLDELDGLARKNAKAIQLNAQSIESLQKQVDNIVSCTCDAETPRVGYSAEVKEIVKTNEESNVGSLLSLLDKMDSLIERLEGKSLSPIKLSKSPASLTIPSAPVVAQATTTPLTVGTTAPYVSAFDSGGVVTSSRIVSVGRPVVTSVGTPRITTSFVGSTACNNPNCTDPNCLNRTNTSFNTMFSPGNQYSAGNNRVVRGRFKCENGACYRIK